MEGGRTLTPERRPGWTTHRTRTCHAGDGWRCRGSFCGRCAPPLTPPQPHFNWDCDSRLLSHCTRPQRTSRSTCSDQTQFIFPSNSTVLPHAMPRADRAPRTRRTELGTMALILSLKCPHPFIQAAFAPKSRVLGTVRAPGTQPRAGWPALP